MDNKEISVTSQKEISMRDADLGTHSVVEAHVESGTDITSITISANAEAAVSIEANSVYCYYYFACA
jgi:hypothetical protein